MSSRTRVALGLTLLLALLIPFTVLAKGNFSFIAIQGPNMKDAVRLANPALTDDWFAFADLTKPIIEVPATPGVGYEVTRYYVDRNREQAFDRLHYYPDAGFVYYDGIVNGRSNYDGHWYASKSEIKATFENALDKEELRHTVFIGRR
jgi:hypothetical protein